MPLVVHSTTEPSGMATDTSSAITNDSGSQSVQTNGLGAAITGGTRFDVLAGYGVLATNSSITATTAAFDGNTYHIIYNTSGAATDFTGYWFNPTPQITQIEPPRRAVLNGNGPLGQAAREAEAAERIEEERRQREIDAIRQQRLAAYQQHERQLQEEYQAVQVARTRARVLLMSLLTETQRTMLEQHGYFDVRGGRTGRVYRIRQGSHGNIYLMHDDGQQMVAKLCGQPEGVPTEDMMLAQKLQIEYDEDGFLNAANLTPILDEPQRPRYRPRYVRAERTIRAA